MLADIPVWLLSSKQQDRAYKRFDRLQVHRVYPDLHQRLLVLILFHPRPASFSVNTISLLVVVRNNYRNNYRTTLYSRDRFTVVS